MNSAEDVKRILKEMEFIKELRGEIIRWEDVAGKRN